eukprot:GHVP01055323.1.p1 GENE.GHVP01055323.1~~GHVP01055323.1.p1  ORF type:complete len:168 (+),score=30.13 GHVP01055323.1:100-603(+)
MFIFVLLWTCLSKASEHSSDGCLPHVGLPNEEKFNMENVQHSLAMVDAISVEIGNTMSTIEDILSWHKLHLEIIDKIQEPISRITEEIAAELGVASYKVDKSKRKQQIKSLSNSVLTSMKGTGSIMEIHIWLIWGLVSSLLVFSLLLIWKLSRAGKNSSLPSYSPTL